MKFQFLSLEMEFDPDATQQWYQDSKPWSCECGHCRNFLRLAQKGLLPSGIQKILDNLQIPAEKATYVCQIMPKNEGDLYQFSYRIAGTDYTNVSVQQSWGEVRCCQEPYPYGAPNFPQPHFDLEFWAILPWFSEDSEQHNHIH